MRRAHASNRRVVATLAVAVVAAWLWARTRGGRADAAIAFVGKEGQASALVSAKGQLMLALSDAPVDAGRAWTVLTASVSAADFDAVRDDLGVDDSTIWQAAGFCIGRATDVLDRPGTWCAFVGVPHWVIVVVAAWTPARRARAWWRDWRRRRLGLCAACGYDLRASAGRCPECGTDRT
jgi:hypothetical protein